MSWPGEVFRTRPEDIESRMLDPDEGIVLVETGVDIHPLLTGIDTNADALIMAAHRRKRIPYNPRSEASWYWDDKSKDLNRVYEGATELLGELKAVTAEIKKDVEEALEPGEGIYHPHPQHSVQITAARRSQPTPRHIDYWQTTIWCGATKPALKVPHKDEWVSIDDVPPGHGLWWRGAYSYNQTDKLPAIRHWAPYRSMARRIVALA